MGPLGVVGREPGLGDRAHLLERIEEIGVEHLFAVCPVEAFDEGVLIGLAGLNVTQACQRVPCVSPRTYRQHLPQPQVQ
jgi:hypothetical protein